jgi:hypothetical protein
MTEHRADASARLLRMMYDFTVSRALYAACELGVADALGGDSLTAAELAAATDLPEDSVVRLMRLLVAVGVFHRDDADRYACTALGQLLRGDDEFSIRDEFRQQLEFLAWADVLPSLRAGSAALTLSGGRGYYQRLDQAADDRQRFLRACRSRSRSVFAALLARHPWPAAATVVDLGGGLGHHLEGVLAAQPTAYGMLYDQADVVAVARTQPRAESVESRMRYQAGDFMVDPLPKADTYLLGNILHNLPDAPASALLSRVRTEVPGCRRLVIAEQVLPERGNHPALANDLWMLVLLGGRERTADEYRSLLAGAGWELAERDHDPRRFGDLLTCHPAS